jgi:NAD(P)H-dependent flavin oxidoreductase YrpB (nitropropane dioxygenase family)
VRTPATELFGIELPVFAFSHCRDVVAEVTRAGGMGVLGAVSHSVEELETDLAWIDGRVDGRPYGVDLIVPATYAGDERGGLDLAAARALVPDTHRDWLRGLLDRYGVPPLPEDTGRIRLGADPAGVAPFSAARAQQQLEVALSHRPALVANALGPPPPAMIEAAHAAGARVAALAGTRAHAARHAAAGVDLVVAQGYEAGGHTGELGTMVLVPEVVDEVAPIPVLAAGGIGRGRQMAAAMALGAAGVWCGSVWLTTEEAETHPVVKRKLVAASSSDTVRSRSLTGKPARQLRTAWTDAWEEPGAPSPLPMPLQSMLVAEAQARIGRAAHRPGSGAEALANYFVGQVVGSMQRELPTRQVVQGLVEEFIDAVERLGALLD